jgi:hypothetical protein
MGRPGVSRLRASLAVVACPRVEDPPVGAGRRKRTRIRAPRVIADHRGAPVHASGHDPSKPEGILVGLVREHGWGPAGDHDV